MQENWLLWNKSTSAKMACDHLAVWVPYCWDDGTLASLRDIRVLGWRLRRHLSQGIVESRRLPLLCNSWHLDGWDGVIISVPNEVIKKQWPDQDHGIPNSKLLYFRSILILSLYLPTIVLYRKWKSVNILFCYLYSCFFTLNVLCNCLQMQRHMVFHESRKAVACPSQLHHGSTLPDLRIFNPPRIDCAGTVSIIQTSLGLTNDLLGVPSLTPSQVPLPVCTRFIDLSHSRQAISSNWAESLTRDTLL